MKKNTLTYLLFFLFCCIYTINAQSNFFENKFTLHRINPSMHGINLNSRVGLQYSSINYKNGLNSEHNHLYGNYAFEKRNFTIALEANTLNMSQLGLEENEVKVSYVYDLRVGYDMYLLGGINFGWKSLSVDPKLLLFGDQLNISTGIITETNDPLARIDLNNSFFDVGASALVYSSKFLFGFHATHLNEPYITFDRQSKIKEKIKYTLLSMVELDLNPRKIMYRLLPQDSYFLGGINMISHGEFNRITVSEELILSKISLGTYQSLLKSESFSATEIGVFSSISLNNVSINLNYSFQSANGDFNIPGVFKIGLEYNFYKFFNTRRGNFKFLSTDNLR
jgi:hypothetical protein